MIKAGAERWVFLLAWIVTDCIQIPPELSRKVLPNPKEEHRVSDRHEKIPKIDVLHLILFEQPYDLWLPK